MDDMSARLSEILNDPAAMEKVRAMAEGLLGEKAAESKQSDPVSDLNSLIPASGLDSAQIGNIIKIMSTLNSTRDNTREKLLLALKPHISESRRDKVDAAVKLLRLIEALPLLKESGILNLI